MKTILEFNHSEQEAAGVDLKSLHWWHTCYSLDSWLRDQIKYHDKDYEDVRDMLHELLADNQISLDDMS